MTRNQIFTTLEFINDNVRMVLGEYYNDKFYIYDVYETPSSGLVSGVIVDEAAVSSTIKQIRDDINAKHDIMIEEVSLILPSRNLNIMAFNSSSPVTGKNLLISEQDIDAAYKVASKVRHDENEKIISIVPVEYYLDTGEKMDFAPIRYRSTTFKILFNVLLLPTSLFDKYVNIISNCNLKIGNYFLDSECLYAGIFEEGDINCAIVNLNRSDTSLTLFKRGKLLSYYDVERGSKEVEEVMLNKYQVKLSDLNRVCYVLGNASTNESNKRAVYKNENYAPYKYLNQYQIDEVIEEKYSSIYQELLAKTNFDTNIYDVYLTGKGAMISNMDTYFGSLINAKSQTSSPSTLYLNNPSFVQTIGLIRLNYKKLMENKTVLENNQSSGETKESKFDKFILDENELE